MFCCNDERKKEYKNEMFSRKISVREYFFSLSRKRKMIKYLLKWHLTRNVTELFTPYSYNDIEFEVDYFSNKRIAVYTAVYGNYDSIREPVVKPDNCDFYIFTDSVVLKSTSAWNVRPFWSQEFQKFTNTEKNRFIKMHPHLLFPEYDYSIYVDGNIEIVTDLTEFIQSFNEYGLKLHKHFRRNCIYEEIDECIVQKKCDISQLIEYKEKLHRINFPKNFGLLEAPMICREHHNSRCIEIMEKWWDEFYLNIRRDQIALVYVLYIMGLDIDKLAGLGRDIHSNYSFIQHSHI